MLIIPYLLLYLFWDVSNFGPFATYLQLINLGDSNFQGYIDNSEAWFTEEGDINAKLGISGVGAFSAISAFIYRIVSCYVMYYGYKLLEQDHRLSVFYWSTIVALFISTIGGSIEIFSRFVCWAIVYEPILLGVIITTMQFSNIHKKIFMYLVVFFYYGISFIWGITKPSLLGYAFVWDI